MTNPSTILQILDLARWAPSGDNTQCWRFQILSDEHVVVHGFDTRNHCVYDLDGHPSQISLGALLETVVIAATRFGLRAEVTRRQGLPEEQPKFDVRFHKEDGLREDELTALIPERRVQRRPLRLRRLTTSEKHALERAVQPGFQLSWLEGWSGRAKTAWLNFRSAKLRLTLPEAYQVHRDVIEWKTQFSEDRIPDAALGASAPTLAVMHWAMASWRRVAFLNRYLAGTLMPRIELDLIPGLACAAHCVILATHAPTNSDDYVDAGRVLQRFWLTAASLGLQFQPEYTPLVFARYAREAITFAAEVRAQQIAHAVRAALEHLLGPNVAPRALFMGRIGAGPPANARSTRLPLERLLLSPALPQQVTSQTA